MSAGVGGLAGAIPLARPDPVHGQGRDEVFVLHGVDLRVTCEGTSADTRSTEGCFQFRLVS